MENEILTAVGIPEWVDLVSESKKPNDVTQYPNLGVFGFVEKKETEVEEETRQLDKEIAEFIAEQPKATIPDDLDTVEMSLKLSLIEYEILQSEMPLFGVKTSDEFLLLLIKGRELVLNALRAPLQEIPTPSVSEVKTVEIEIVEEVAETETVRTTMPYYPKATSEPKKNGWMIAFVVLVVIVVLSVIYWAMKSKKGGETVKNVANKAVAAILDTNGLDI